MKRTALRHHGRESLFLMANAALVPSVSLPVSLARLGQTPFYGRNNVGPPRRRYTTRGNGARGVPVRGFFREGGGTSCKPSHPPPDRLQERLGGQNLLPAAATGLVASMMGGASSCCRRRPQDGLSVKRSCLHGAAAARMSHGSRGMGDGRECHGTVGGSLSLSRPFTPELVAHSPPPPRPARAELPFCTLVQ